MYFNKYIAFQLLILFINPILSFFTSIYFIIKVNKKFSPIIISISIALFFIYLPILYDTSSNYYLIKMFTFRNLFDISSYTIYNQYIYKAEKFFDLQYMTIIFIITSFILFIWFKFLAHYKEKTTTQIQLYYIIIFAFSSLIYRNILDLNRFYLAISFFLFILYLLETKLNKLKNRIIITILMFLSVMIHPSTILIVFLYFLCYKIKNLNFYIILPFIFIILSLFANNLVEIILNIIPTISESVTILLGRASDYTGGERWGSDNGLGGFRYILRAIEISLMLLLHYQAINLLKLKIGNHIIIKLIIFTMSISIFFLSFHTLFERYSIAYFLFASYIVYTSVINNIKIFNIKLILLLFLARFLTFNFLIYGILFTSSYNDVLPDESAKIDMIIKPIIYPTILLLDIKENGYSDEYIEMKSLRGKKFL